MYLFLLLLICKRIKPDTLLPIIDKHVADNQRGEGSEMSPVIIRSLHHELLAGSAECGQDEDGVDGDGAGFPRALVASLDPATLLGELVVLDHHDEFSLPEAEEGGVVCGGGGREAEFSEGHQGVAATWLASYLVSRPPSG